MNKLDHHQIDNILLVNNGLIDFGCVQCIVYICISLSALLLANSNKMNHTVAMKNERSATKVIHTIRRGASQMYKPSQLLHQSKVIHHTSSCNNERHMPVSSFDKEGGLTKVNRKQSFYSIKVTIQLLTCYPSQIFTFWTKLSSLLLFFFFGFPPGVLNQWSPD